jgi:hypothetical protein
VTASDADGDHEDQRDGDGTMIMSWLTDAYFSARNAMMTTTRRTARTITSHHGNFFFGGGGVAATSNATDGPP